MASLLKSKTAPFVILVLLCITAFLFYQKHKQRGPSLSTPYQFVPDTRFMITPCLKNKQLMNLSFSGKVVLNEKFMKNGEPKELQLQEAVREQLRFLTGYINSQREIQNQNGRAIVSGQEPEIKFGAIKSESYGNKLLIHPQQGFERIPYTQAAVKMGQTQPSDRAWTMTYHVKVFAAGCNSPEEPLKTVLLPMDPYLANWLVPKEKWRKLRFGNGPPAVVNPCADGEIADMPYSVHYWYVWEPRAKRKDADGVEYDCKDLLMPNKDYGIFKSDVTFLKDVTGETTPYRWVEEFFNRKDISITFIFGHLQSSAYKFDAMETQRLMEETLKKHFSWTRHIYAPRFKDLGKIDVGQLGMLFFLARLPEVMDLEKFEIIPEFNRVTLKISGRLTSNSKNLKLKIVYSMTDAHLKVFPGHWQPFYDGLVNDDAVFYNGHSGLGTNLTLKGLATALKKSPEEITQTINSKDYQFVGVSSCYSYSYFGADILEQRKGKTDMMLWASSTYRPAIGIQFLKYISGNSSSTAKDSFYNAMTAGLTPHDLVVFETTKAR